MSERIEGDLEGDLHGKFCIGAGPVRYRGKQDRTRGYRVMNNRTLKSEIRMLFSQLFLIA